MNGRDQLSEPVGVVSTMCEKGLKMYYISGACVTDRLAADNIVQHVEAAPIMTGNATEKYTRTCARHVFGHT